MSHIELSKSGLDSRRKISSSELRRYRVRMECLGDWELIACALGGIAFEITEEAAFLPQPDDSAFETCCDVGMSFYTQRHITIVLLRWVLNELVDCHVAAESLAAYDEYTAGRIELEPSRHCSRPPLSIVAKVKENLLNYAEYLECQQSRATDAAQRMDANRSGQTPLFR